MLAIMLNDLMETSKLGGLPRARKRKVNPTSAPLNIGSTTTHSLSEASLRGGVGELHLAINDAPITAVRV